MEPWKAKGTYLSSDRIYPNFVAHAQPEDAEVVGRGYKPHVLVQQRGHDGDRSRRDVVEPCARRRGQLGDEKGDEREEHRRNRGNYEEGLRVP